MSIFPMQKKLMEVIGEGHLRFRACRDFMVEHGANMAEMTDVYHLALWIEGAPMNVKEDFLDLFNDHDWPSLRICSQCGCFMDEGYMLGNQYACSDACAIALYNGDEEQLRKDIGDGDGEDYFWTQWY